MEFNALTQITSYLPSTPAPNERKLAISFVSILTTILTNMCERSVFPTLNVQHKAQQIKGVWNKGSKVRKFNHNWIKVFSKTWNEAGINLPSRKRETTTVSHPNKTDKNARTVAEPSMNGRAISSDPKTQRMHFQAQSLLICLCWILPIIWMLWNQRTQSSTSLNNYPITIK